MVPYVAYVGMRTRPRASMAAAARWRWVVRASQAVVLCGALCLTLLACPWPELWRRSSASWSAHGYQLHTSKQKAHRLGSIRSIRDRTTRGIGVYSTTKLYCGNKQFQYDIDKIRNFCIIAHVDHGKSTLADRLLELTKTIPARSMQQQVLDNNPIERERGITIKLQAARILHYAKDGQQYLLNLIDTPGHVDFGYEVSRSLAACEGALLVVDATQGVEAQTLANVHLAKEYGLKILPVINKIDLPSADPEKCILEIESSLGLSCKNILRCSAKTGEGIDNILDAIVNELPNPRNAGSSQNPTRALIFDSYYDQYKGVVPLVRVIDGTLHRGDRLKFINSNAECDALEIGFMTPSHVPSACLQTGEVGYLAGAIRSLSDARVGDTVSVIRRNARHHDGICIL
jgi:GTP-binding protein LepA